MSSLKPEIFHWYSNTMAKQSIWSDAVTDTEPVFPAFCERNPSAMIRLQRQWNSVLFNLFMVNQRDPKKFCVKLNKAFPVWQDCKQRNLLEWQIWRKFTKQLTRTKHLTHLLNSRKGGKKRTLEEEIIDKNPMKKGQKPKVEKAEADYYTPEDIEKILEALDMEANMGIAPHKCKPSDDIFSSSLWE